MNSLQQYPDTVQYCSSWNFKALCSYPNIFQMRFTLLSVPTCEVIRNPLSTTNMSSGAQRRRKTRRGRRLVAMSPARYSTDRHRVLWPCSCLRRRRTQRAVLLLLFCPERLSRFEELRVYMKSKACFNLSGVCCTRTRYFMVVMSNNKAHASHNAWTCRELFWRIDPPPHPHAAPWTHHIGTGTIAAAYNK